MYADVLKDANSSVMTRVVVMRTVNRSRINYSYLAIDPAGKEPGRAFSKLMKENMYLQFTDSDSFAAFRLRAGQGRLKEA
jgi:hypothetical protein